MEGDADEEDIDDIEHEFNIEDENKIVHNENAAAEAMLHGKLSYGRGPNDDEYTPVSQKLFFLSYNKISLK